MIRTPSSFPPLLFFLFSSPPTIFFFFFAAKTSCTFHHTPQYILKKWSNMMPINIILTFVLVTYTTAYIMNYEMAISPANMYRMKALWRHLSSSLAMTRWNKLTVTRNWKENIEGRLSSMAPQPYTFIRLSIKALPIPFSLSELFEIGFKDPHSTSNLFRARPRLSKIQINTCRIAWIWAINFFHFSSIKIPVANCLCNCLLLQINIQLVSKSMNKSYTTVIKSEYKSMQTQNSVWYSCKTVFFSWILIILKF